MRPVSDSAPDGGGLVRPGAAPRPGPPPLADAGVELLGRGPECRAVEAVAHRVRSGRSEVLVVRGEAGIGKTALLDHLVRHSAGCRVLRAAGVESEMELAFGGLHQLCAPLLERIDQLPAPQRAAMSTAFGLSAGEPPDRFMVGMAVLNLLADAAADRPLLCIVDDVQWFDQVSAQTLAFVARRVLVEPLGFVFTVREPSQERELVGLPELVVTGLGRQDSLQLLRSAIPGPLDQRVRDRILAETRGNPLALLELPHGLSSGEIAGGFGVPDPPTLATRIERGFLRRLHELPEPTQKLLLAAAAEPLGDVTLLWRAAQLLHIEADAATAAEAAGLVELGTRVRFRHPLVRSAIYRSADLPSRR
ncbi:MAG TPA: AAA family ATPase, partial [Marmoricola sp.]